ncbi:T9SS type A sorting domain-containing protein [Flavobacterium sp. NST-5]|uniref:T9SS type A sorting domain-containing protein n=1 Tax=Flavobacterium ichthyis TaxID=2698827 RepID=A0ABW9Z6W3_9FLAO|nr:T9SS type A sorting domain-containing protein [Flavobacterium ichthyis]NBL64608.1 T9SS type A sorting domain-containing protein [Flavobacterium ichthyis]
MKTKLLFAAFLLGNFVGNSQIVISPNPFNINTGNITVTYGSAGDYTLFDPLSDPNLYLYSGLETDGDAATWDFHDDWTNLATLTPLIWDATANAYVANLNIATRNYIEETTSNFAPIPSGTTVNDYYFLIRNAAGDRQSADLKGSDYGMTPAVFLSTKNFSNKNIFQIANGEITTNLAGKSKIEIFALNGSKVKTIEINNLSETVQQKIDLQPGIFIATIFNNGKQKTIKFVQN